MTEVHARVATTAQHPHTAQPQQRKVDDWLLSEIAKQLHLSKPELLRFILPRNL